MCIFCRVHERSSWHGICRWRQTSAISLRGTLNRKRVVPALLEKSLHENYKTLILAVVCGKNVNWGCLRRESWEEDFDGSNTTLENIANELFPDLSFSLNIISAMNWRHKRALYIFLLLKHPDRFWGPPNLLFSGYRCSFSGGKMAGAWGWPLTSI